jgi:exopolysaccharide biosynthesis polyprenyl glycosylphosphotransferase
VIGAGHVARAIFTVLRQHEPDSEVELLSRMPTTNPHAGDTVAIRSASDLEHYLLKRQPDRIVLATSRAGRVVTDALIRPLAKGIVVENGLDLYERLTGKLLVSHLPPSWIIDAKAVRKRLSYCAWRRSIAVTLALLGLILFAPIMLVCFVLIPLDSPGGVLFRQERVGLGGRRFVMWKFRTMRADAESCGAVWARENDDRVTRIGRLLRRTHLDELPQLVNVLRGDMALVGPRPERPCFVEQLEREISLYAQRHVVRPGITGWAQVCFRYGASVQDVAEKLAYDLYYVKHRSLRLDLKILLATLAIAVTGEGSR